MRFQQKFLPVWQQLRVRRPAPHRQPVLHLRVRPRLAGQLLQLVVRHQPGQRPHLAVQRREPAHPEERP